MQHLAASCLPASRCLLASLPKSPLVREMRGQLQGACTPMHQASHAAHMQQAGRGPRGAAGSAPAGPASLERDGPGGHQPGAVVGQADHARPAVHLRVHLPGSGRRSGREAFVVRQQQEPACRRSRRGAARGGGGPWPPSRACAPTRPSAHLDAVPQVHCELPLQLPHKACSAVVVAAARWRWRCGASGVAAASGSAATAAAPSAKPCRQAAACCPACSGTGQRRAASGHPCPERTRHDAALRALHAAGGVGDGARLVGVAAKRRRRRRRRHAAAAGRAQRAAVRVRVRGAAGAGRGRRTGRELAACHGTAAAAAGGRAKRCYPSRSTHKAQPCPGRT